MLKEKKNSPFPIYLVEYRVVDFTIAKVALIFNSIVLV